MNNILSIKIIELSDKTKEDIVFFTTIQNAFINLICICFGISIEDLDE